MTEIDLAAIDAERERIRTSYLQPDDSRPATSARGLHHVALVARGTSIYFRDPTARASS